MRKPGVTENVTFSTWTPISQGRHFASGKILVLWGLTLRTGSHPHPLLLCSSLSSPGLVNVENSRSSHTENQLFPVNRLSLALQEGHAALSLQIADLHCKNRNAGASHVYANLPTKPSAENSYLLVCVHIGPEKPLYLFHAHLNSLRVPDPFTFPEGCLASCGHFLTPLLVVLKDILPVIADQVPENCTDPTFWWSRLDPA